MTTPINSRRGLRTPLANAVRRREAEAVMERGLPEGYSEDEILRGASSYDRVPGMRRAIMGAEDQPRRPSMRVDEQTNLGDYVRNRPRNMRKGGLVKAKPPARKPTSKATRPAVRNRKQSGPK
jgi:hypothetical protein